MKLLVIGSGGREHALVWKLAQSPHVTQMWCAPGNARIGLERLARNGALVECVNIGAEDLAKLLAFAHEKKPDLTVVGPDNPLALGIVDLFQKHGLRIWGVNQKAAQFESSKVFAQKFMEEYGIPTARAGTFNDVAAARKFCASLGGKCVVKADGLALGKGVLICANQAEAEEAVDEILVNKAFGAAGARVVIQEFLQGVEISLHALCDGKTVKMFPTSQDHKRALDGDKGLNTGGMGTYSPTPFLTDAQLTDAGRKILNPFMRGCAAEGIDYRGILYPGIMLTKSLPCASKKQIPINNFGWRASFPVRGWTNGEGNDRMKALAGPRHGAHAQERPALPRPPAQAGRHRAVVPEKNGQSTLKNIPPVERLRLPAFIPK
ncbi:MAG: phosphoribosylamine--glycine ligase [Pedosphaera sp.]|nr:phosphoribosylamine--glycine ligase [Pedosphaera sp.]